MNVSKIPISKTLAPVKAVLCRTRFWYQNFIYTLLRLLLYLANKLNCHILPEYVIKICNVP